MHCRDVFTDRSVSGPNMFCNLRARSEPNGGDAGFASESRIGSVRGSVPQSEMPVQPLTTCGGLLALTLVAAEVCNFNSSKAAVVMVWHLPTTLALQKFRDRSMSTAAEYKVGSQGGGVIGSRIKTGRSATPSGFKYMQ